jgi:hypothetical protein
MNQFSFKQLFLISFVKLECCYKLLQFKNVLQLTIELIICAPMSQHNGFRMLSIFNYTFSSQHLENQIENVLQLSNYNFFSLHYIMQTPT